jgi:hypothetical protein
MDKGSKNSGQGQFTKICKFIGEGRTKTLRAINP